MSKREVETMSMEDILKSARSAEAAKKARKEADARREEAAFKAEEEARRAHKEAISSRPNKPTKR